MDGWMDGLQNARDGSKEKSGLLFCGVEGVGWLTTDFLLCS